MRKSIGVFVTGILTAALLAGCGSTAGTAGNADTAASSGNSASAAASSVVSDENAGALGAAAVSGTTSAADADSQEGGKTLVLYYSASGHTKDVADMIAADTGADEYEITPSEPYTEEDLDYNDENSRVVKEYQDASLQDVAFDSYDVPDWDSYDTVFVGYPIWWQDASWVVKSFVKHLDFTGKTVIPFATSSSSGLGDSGKNLEELAGSGNWLEGERFARDASEADVQSWVDGLGM